MHCPLNTVFNGQADTVQKILIFTTECGRNIFFKPEYWEFVTSHELDTEGGNASHYHRITVPV